MEDEIYAEYTTEELPDEKEKFGVDEFEEHENEQDNEDTKSLNLKEEDNDSDSGHSEYLPTKTPIRGKRKRGRPRKHPVKVKSGRPRGRPPGIYRKIKAEDLEDDG